MEEVLINRLDELSVYYEDDLNLLKELLRKSGKYFEQGELEKIAKAYKCANDLHRGQKRQSGDPYIIHPASVALILLTEMHLIDSDAICSALLHDTIEDTGISGKALGQLFNLEIAYLVESVSKMKNLNLASKSEEERYNACILLRNCAKDIRVIMIKIADRLHNMRTLIYKGDKALIEKYNKSTLPIEELKITPSVKQNEISLETITLFVPLAQRIGASVIAQELEDISNMYLRNSLFREVSANIKNFVSDHQYKIEWILESINNCLLKSHIEHEIRVKAKSFSEVNRYLESKRINNVSEVPGLLTFEINVDLKAECYKVMKVLMKAFGSYEIKVIDYIVNPKANGYQALNLEVKDLIGHTLKFRICTYKMKLINDCGLAALTEIYGDRSIKDIQDSLNETNSFVMSLQSIGALYKNNNSYFKHIEEEILAKQITITTKDGEKLTFPIGATVLDLAFRLHSEIGKKAIGAIINGVEVSKDYILKDGDVVNIIIDDEQLYQPRESLDQVMTSYAKREIKKALSRIRKNK